MRIIGGRYRGKKLISPASDKVRPTSDKARGALFNILRSRLGNDWRDYHLIDVFSGSGAFGLEALSQGFGSVTLVDIDVRELKKNTALFANEAAKIEIINADATKAFVTNRLYDAAFLDAPYAKGLTEAALTVLADKLKNKALCLIEVEKNETCLLPPQYRLLNEKHYGIAKILIAEFIS